MTLNYEYEKAINIASAVCDAMYGGELGWIEMDTKVFIAEFRKRWKERRNMVNLNDENRKRVDAIRNSISRWVKILGSGGDDREFMELIEKLALDLQNSRSDEPGTPIGRLNYIGKLAEELGQSPFSSRGPEGYIENYVHALQEMTNKLCDEIRWMRHNQLWNNPDFRIDREEYHKLYEIAKRIQGHLQKKEVV